MAIKTVYIARHGYRSNWLPTGPYPAPPTGVIDDVQLAPHGLEQAEELAKYVKSLDVKPELAFSSPFYRCLQTVKPTKLALDIPLFVERGLGEWFRPDREVIPIPRSNDILMTFFPNIISDDWEDVKIPSGKGETEEDIFKRCNEFWPLFISHVEAQFPDVETVMFVTHAATKAALGMNLLKFPNATVAIDDKGTLIRNGSCAIDRFDCVKAPQGKDFYSSEWDLVMNGNTSFLTKGEEMNWDFKNKWEAGSDEDIKARRLANAAIATQEAKSKLE